MGVWVTDFHERRVNGRWEFLGNLERFASNRATGEFLRDRWSVRRPPPDASVEFRRAIEGDADHTTGWFSLSELRDVDWLEARERAGYVRADEYPTWLARWTRWRAAGGGGAFSPPLVDRLRDEALFDPELVADEERSSGDCVDGAYERLSWVGASWHPRGPVLGEGELEVLLRRRREAEDHFGSDDWVALSRAADEALAAAFVHVEWVERTLDVHAGYHRLIAELAHLGSPDDVRIGFQISW